MNDLSHSQGENKVDYNRTHPLRHDLTDHDCALLVERAQADDTTLTVEECEAALDWLFDVIAHKLQTHPTTRNTQ